MSDLENMCAPRGDDCLCLDRSLLQCLVRYAMTIPIGKKTSNALAVSEINPSVKKTFLQIILLLDFPLELRNRKTADSSLKPPFRVSADWKDMDSGPANISNSQTISYVADTEREIPQIPLNPLELLNQYAPKVKRLRVEDSSEKKSDPPPNPASSGHGQAIPAASIIKMAKARLLQLNSQKADIVSYASTSFGAQCGLPSAAAEDFELALRLLAAAEKVAKQQFVYARKLLSLCESSVSQSGNPIQRVGYYFADALQEKIDKEWGLVSSEEMERIRKGPTDVEQTMIRLRPEMTRCQQEIPFCLYTQFTAIQSILDCVASAKRVHLIDFGIDNGSHWTLIMQAFSVRFECPLEHLKITAVGASKQMMEDTGKWLSSFAETISLPFSFSIIVSEMKDLKEGRFGLEADDTVAVYLGLRLWTLLPWPNQLDKFIKLIRNLNPRLIVVNEMEASINSPDFLKRFNESIHVFSAIFDCINSCMYHRVMFRKLNEEVIFPGMIRNIVIAEGIEWIQRYEKISVWRALFGKFGIVETDMSRPPPDQEILFLRSSDRLTSCTVELDGKCLLLGWKGSAIQSVSAWKIKQDD
ncbi:scarecrow-like protein 3 [Coffea eugenioides]|uniref:scarecrow-like protein 3 n=1 Tax=Coffea eugenioides TaxID=49369 RepID=UPI000F6111D9|nr:scarecrow-like protein 3 [Coffea eugenioides]